LALRHRLSTVLPTSIQFLLQKKTRVSLFTLALYITLITFVKRFFNFFKKFFRSEFPRYLKNDVNKTKRHTHAVTDYISVKNFKKKKQDLKTLVK
jgi:hypothetical protein